MCPFGELGRLHKLLPGICIELQRSVCLKMLSADFVLSFLFDLPPHFQCLHSIWCSHSWEEVAVV